MTRVLHSTFHHLCSLQFFLECIVFFFAVGHSRCRDCAEQRPSLRYKVLWNWMARKVRSSRESMGIIAGASKLRAGRCLQSRPPQNCSSGFLRPVRIHICEYFGKMSPSNTMNATLSNVARDFRGPYCGMSIPNCVINAEEVGLLLHVSDDAFCIRVLRFLFRCYRARA